MFWARVRHVRLLLGFAVLAWVHAAELNVYAAASLADALQAIGRSYEAASGDKLRFNLGASSTLALQIALGAPADVFFSADEAHMDELVSAGLIDIPTRRPLLSNTLVVVVNATDGAPVKMPGDLARPEIRRLALAEPSTVPAGKYAKGWLQRIALWNQVAPRVLATENVRGCLAAVEAGNADAGVVYKTDALTSNKVRIAYEVPAADAPVISYPVAVMKNAKHAAAAQKFATYLRSAEARATFLQFGFLPAR
jgi:molybdate transport system substrate-binding protein